MNEEQLCRQILAPRLQLERWVGMQNQIGFLWAWQGWVFGGGGTLWWWWLQPEGRLMVVEICKFKIGGVLFQVELVGSMAAAGWLQPTPTRPRENRFGSTPPLSILAGVVRQESGGTAAEDLPEYNVCNQ